MPLSLPSVLDSTAAAPLRTALLGMLEASEPLRLDGTDVTRVGQACLQVLAATAADASAAGLGFHIGQPSAELTEGCALAGLSTLVGQGQGGSKR